MIKLRNQKDNKTPEMQISPMIDMIFLLLVFFILSTMYMSELKTIPIRMPVAKNAIVQTRTTFVVSVKEDGSIWLSDKKTDVDTLTYQAATEVKSNPEMSVIIRADKKANYGQVMTVLDKLKGAGVTRFGMATDFGNEK